MTSTRLQKRIREELERGDLTGHELLQRLGAGVRRSHLKAELRTMVRENALIAYDGQPALYGLRQAGRER